MNGKIIKMSLKKTKKRTKTSRMHGRKMGTHGWGARKKHKKTGHRGGKGMSWEINLSSYKILGTGEALQGGLPHKGAKNKLIIKAKEASKSAIDKVKKAGGEIIFPTRKEMIVLKEKQKIESSPNIVASLKKTKNKEKK